MDWTGLDSGLDTFVSFVFFFLGLLFTLLFSLYPFLLLFTGFETRLVLYQFIFDKC